MPVNRIEIKMKFWDSRNRFLGKCVAKAGMYDGNIDMLYTQSELCNLYILPGS